MNTKDSPRLFLSVGILLLFAYAYVRNPADDLLIGSLIAMATTAVNWWMGSSKGSSDKSDQLERQANETQEVTVTNKPGDPVPTAEERSRA